MSAKTIGNTTLNLLFRSGIFDILQKNNRSTLTVLNYHRIEGKKEAVSKSFQPNISASPQVFDDQMMYLASNYNVISEEHFLDWMQNKASLPDFPALITFDDGYHDNLTNALPILKKYNYPAIIFLASGFIGKNKGFYWDKSAYCFANTKKKYATLPILGKKVWDNEPASKLVLGEWVEILKRVSESEKQSAMKALPSILEVEIPENLFGNVMLSWEEARNMQAHGISFGAHTVSHPILTRVPLEQAEYEIAESKNQIEGKLGIAVRTFAYPNGQKQDISPEVIHAVKRAGFQAAFSLIAGPSPFDEVQREPFSIRRIFIGQADTLPRFAAKLAGISRIMKKKQIY
jgi:peptidoglycan/xylan/chitin deacetylase (PgdA/CDA1 family)